MTIPSPRKLNPLTRRQGSAALVLAAGLAFLWTMWRAGGDHWPAQRPFMLVTLICAAVFIVLIMLSVLAPRGAAKRLLSGGAFLAALAMFLGEGLAEASKMFSGQVRHAPEWGDHWFGCSTRP